MKSSRSSRHSGRELRLITARYRMMKNRLPSLRDVIKSGRHLQTPHVVLLLRDGSEPAHAARSAVEIYNYVVESVSRSRHLANGRARHSILQPSERTYVAAHELKVRGPVLDAARLAGDPPVDGAQAQRHGQRRHPVQAHQHRVAPRVARQPPRQHPHLDRKVVRFLKLYKKLF